MPCVFVLAVILREIRAVFRIVVNERFRLLLAQGIKNEGPQQDERRTKYRANLVRYNH